ncbi:DUF58 domain-containing protein [Clostridium pasteurianum]|uniref:DUF58 domain-containing protein n=1 Tax=Clostridium pasteurianum TaxID=1501 RepID=UPI001FA8106D|nr:DUF58 domain-containing protein [Clostridium pasteurianum]
MENKKFFTGENIKISLHFHNRSLFLYSNVNFLSNFIDAKGNLNESVTLLPFKKLDIQLNFKVPSRGIYNAENYLLEIHDLFLISSRKINFNNKFTFTVYPRNIRLPLEIQKLIDNVSNFSKNNPNTHTSDTYSYIDKYMEGDNFKNIHWKLSAKKNNLYVKKFDTIKKCNIAIYVDMTNILSLPGTFPTVTDEGLVSFSLSIIKYLLWKNEAIYLYIENLKSSSFQLENTEDYYSILSYYLEHKSLGHGNFFDKVLKKEFQTIENHKFIFIITYTILPMHAKTISKISADCENLIIFTLLDVPNKTKNLLRNTNVKVVKVTL